MTNRRKSVFVLGLLAACAGPSACSPDPEPKPSELRARLEADTGVPWVVHTHDRSKAARFLAPTTPVKADAGSPEIAARAFFDRYRDALHGQDGADELRAVVTNANEADGAYVRFEHYLKGTDVRIFDVASTARFTTDGALVWLQSGFRAGLRAVPTSAAVSIADALNRAVAKSTELCGDDGRQDNGPPSAKVGVLTEGDAPRLVWRVQLMTNTERCATPTVTIDATSGDFMGLEDGAESLWDDSPGVRFEALGDKTDVRRIDVTSRLVSLGGKYLMQTEASPAVRTRTYGKVLDADITTDTPGSWDTSASARGAAVDAHYNVMHALRYFRDIHRRRSTTGLGNDVTVVVHHPFADSAGNPTGNNASNNSFAWVINQMRCGDGDYLNGGDWLPLCSAFDVTVHEIAHGVTHYSSGLVYRGESGALNESFSDAMGQAAENAFEVKDAARNFLVAERITKSGRGIRDMQNPSRAPFNHPDHYDNVRPCAVTVADQCSVHSNSGIPNRAFSLMTVGGVHARSNLGVARGIGWEVARELWYETFTKLAPDADFRTAALAQIVEAARRGVDVLQAVGCAWSAVGVVPLSVHPALALLTCPAPAAPDAGGGGSPKAKGPNCDDRASGWACSGNVKNTALQCKDGFVVGGVFCADPDQVCKKTAVDDWTATVSPAGAVTCE